MNVVPAFLLDTCSVINLSYCRPVAALFKQRYQGRAGWVQAVHTELTNQQLRRPPHPQAGSAARWAATWLGIGVSVTDIGVQLEIARLQSNIASGGSASAADHLGEATSIALLRGAGAGRLITDDHGARGEARRQQVAASSTVGVLAQLLTNPNSGVTVPLVDLYLDTLRARQRMHADLTSQDLLAGQLGAWR